MQKILILTLALALAGCSKSGQDLNGTWQISKEVYGAEVKPTAGVAVFGSDGWLLYNSGGVANKCTFLVSGGKLFLNGSSIGLRYSATRKNLIVYGGLNYRLDSGIIETHLNK